jgi:hypothetical protein
MHTSIHSEVTGIARHSRTRVVLTAYFALSPAIGCFATVTLQMKGFVRPG